MSSGAAVLEELQAIKKENASIKETLQTALARRETGAKAMPGLGDRGGFLPRMGVNTMGSQGYSFGKAISYMGGSCQQEDCKHEVAISEKLLERSVAAGYKTMPSGRRPLLVPIWPEAFTTDIVDNDLYCEMKDMLHAGVRGSDPQEVEWLQKKFMYGQKAAASPALSWVDQTLGGSFVPPATFGPPIELLRNMEALMSAGATVMPLGPSGRLTFPRLVQATQFQWAGENIQVPPNTPKTGSLNLSAKKAMSVICMPNELLRFGSPATEQLIRTDMFKSVALGMDLAFLQGPGSDNVPLGLINTPGINTITPTNSNQLAPQDAYSFLSAIEEANGDENKITWIMRPKLAYAFYQARWTPYSGGTSQGGFVFEIIRGFDGKVTKMLCGRPVVATPQVTNTMANGIPNNNGTQTYCLALQGDDYIMGMFGAIEFTQTDAGFTLISSDQTAVRAVISCDGGMRHPGLVSYAPNLTFVVAG